MWGDFAARSNRRKSEESDGRKSATRLDWDENRFRRGPTLQSALVKGLRNFFRPIHTLGLPLALIDALLGSCLILILFQPFHRSRVQLGVRRSLDNLPALSLGISCSATECGIKRDMWTAGAATAVHEVISNDDVRSWLSYPFMTLYTGLVLGDRFQVHSVSTEGTGFESIQENEWLTKSFYLTRPGRKAGGEIESLYFRHSTSPQEFREQLLGASDGRLKRNGELSVSTAASDGPGGESLVANLSSPSFSSAGSQRGFTARIFLLDGLRGDLIQCYVHFENDWRGFFQHASLQVSIFRARHSDSRGGTVVLWVISSLIILLEVLKHCREIRATGRTILTQRPAGNQVGPELRRAAVTYVTRTPSALLFSAIRLSTAGLLSASLTQSPGDLQTSDLARLTTLAKNPLEIALRTFAAITFIVAAIQVLCAVAATPPGATIRHLGSAAARVAKVVFAPLLLIFFILLVPGSDGWLGVLELPAELLVSAVLVNALVVTRTAADKGDGATGLNRQVQALQNFKKTLVEYFVWSKVRVPELLASNRVYDRLVLSVIGRRRRRHQRGTAKNEARLDYLAASSRGVSRPLQDRDRVEEDHGSTPQLHQRRAHLLRNFSILCLGVGFLILAATSVSMGTARSSCLVDWSFDGNNRIAVPEHAIGNFGHAAFTYRPAYTWLPYPGETQIAFPERPKERDHVFPENDNDDDGVTLRWPTSILSGDMFDEILEWLPQVLVLQALNPRFDHARRRATMANPLTVELEFAPQKSVNSYTAMTFGKFWPATMQRSVARLPLLNYIGAGFGQSVCAESYAELLAVGNGHFHFLLTVYLGPLASVYESVRNILNDCLLTDASTPGLVPSQLKYFSFESAEHDGVAVVHRRVAVDFHAAGAPQPEISCAALADGSQISAWYTVEKQLLAAAVIFVIFYLVISEIASAAAASQLAVRSGLYIIRSVKIVVAIVGILLVLGSLEVMTTTFSAGWNRSESPDALKPRPEPGDPPGPVSIVTSTIDALHSIALPSSARAIRILLGVRALESHRKTFTRLTVVGSVGLSVFFCKEIFLPQATDFRTNSGGEPEMGQQSVHENIERFEASNPSLLIFRWRLFFVTTLLLAMLTFFAGVLLAVGATHYHRMGSFALWADAIQLMMIHGGGGGETVPTEGRYQMWIHSVGKILGAVVFTSIVLQHPVAVIICDADQTLALERKHLRDAVARRWKAAEARRIPRIRYNSMVQQYWRSSATAARIDRDNPNGEFARMANVFFSKFAQMPPFDRPPISEKEAMQRAALAAVLDRIQSYIPLIYLIETKIFLMRRDLEDLRALQRQARAASSVSTAYAAKLAKKAVDLEYRLESTRASHVLAGSEFRTDVVDMNIGGKQPILTPIAPGRGGDNKPAASLKGGVDLRGACVEWDTRSAAEGVECVLRYFVNTTITAIAATAPATTEATGVCIPSEVTPVAYVCATRN